MCKICEYKLEEGEVFYDRIHTIKTATRPMGIHTALCTRVLLFGPDFEQYNSISEEENPMKFQLNVEVCVGDYGEDLLEDMYIPIEYCPFCGRKLRLLQPISKEKEDDNQ